MHSFLNGLFGGALIGLAAAILLLCNGDILGASGIVSSVGLHPFSSLRDATQHWKIVLIASFCVTSNLFFASDYQDLDQGLASLSVYAYLLGGFLVGFGTKLGNGCTSGHGICGLARFSKRSIVSVCTFMTFGIVTAVLTQQATTPFPESSFDFLRTDDPDNNPIAMWSKVAATLVFFLALWALVAPSFHNDVTLESFSKNNCLKLAPAAVAGVLFASGLYLSRMVYPTVVFGFLNFGLMPRGEWDATLAFVMGGGLLISATAYQMVDGYTLELLKKCSSSRRLPLTKPIALQQEERNNTLFCIPTSQIIDCELVVGAVLFGLGWGICGLCPGPALFLVSIGVSWVVACYWPAFYLGSFLATKVKECRQSTTERPDRSDEVTPEEENNGNNNENNKEMSPKSQTSNEPNPLAIDV